MRYKISDYHMKYYEPNFCVVSDKMPFTIRVEIELFDKIDGDILQTAVNKSIKRYPYFSIKVVKDDNEYKVIYNGLPIVCVNKDTPITLGSKEVNFHMLAVTYKGDQINFLTSHVLTDGGGFFPFIKTVLYYYLSAKTGKTFDSTGFNLVDTPFNEGELEEPVKKELIDNVKPLYVKKCVDYFRLEDGGYVKEKDEGRIFRFKMPFKETITFSYDNDGSPNALLSSLMAKAIFKVHPDIEKSIVSAVSFNMRPALKNRYSYRLLSSALKIEYPSKLKYENVLKLCTCSRGTVTLQSQPENVLYEMKNRKELFEKIKDMPLKEKIKTVSEKALFDAVDNTFSISYVGKVDYGELSAYIKADYNLTDGSTYKTAFLEIGVVDGFFTIALIQGFSSDVYYKALKQEIENCNIPFIEEEQTALITPKIELPQ